ncbi:MAG TPA: hypothetical protein VHP83_10400 [Aggregatilineaceae bacterium]|nr:hypothetical protein [Aggregatilineaceae bacterium]
MKMGEHALETNLKPYPYPPNYRHPYAIQHDLSADWWWSTVNVVSNSPNLGHLLEALPKETTLLMKLKPEEINSSVRTAPLDEKIVAEWTNAFMRGTAEDVSPYAMFVDITYLGYGAFGHARKDMIDDHCFKHDAVPCIDYSEKWGWVFHTLYVLNPAVLAYKKHIAAEFKVELSRRDVKTEAQIERDLAARLRKHGHQVKRQVRCTAGVADIVTEEAVYEIKRSLTRDHIFSAIGQVLTYRQAINPDLHPIVIGPASTEYITDLIHLARKFGVFIVPLKTN